MLIVFMDGGSIYAHLVVSDKCPFLWWIGVNMSVLMVGGNDHILLYSGWVEVIMYISTIGADYHVRVHCGWE